MDHLLPYDDEYPNDISRLTNDEIIEFIKRHDWPFGSLDYVPSYHGKYEKKTILDLLFVLLKQAQEDTTRETNVIEVVISLNF